MMKSLVKGLSLLSSLVMIFGVSACTVAIDDLSEPSSGSVESSENSTTSSDPTSVVTTEPASIISTSKQPNILVNEGVLLNGLNAINTITIESKIECHYEINDFEHPAYQNNPMKGDKHYTSTEKTADNAYMKTSKDMVDAVYRLSDWLEWRGYESLDAFKEELKGDYSSIDEEKNTFSTSFNMRTYDGDGYDDDNCVVVYDETNKQNVFYPLDSDNDFEPEKGHWLISGRNYSSLESTIKRLRNMIENGVINNDGTVSYLDEEAKENVGKNPLMYKLEFKNNYPYRLSAEYLAEQNVEAWTVTNFKYEMLFKDINKTKVEVPEVEIDECIEHGATNRIINNEGHVDYCQTCHKIVKREDHKTNKYGVCGECGYFDTSKKIYPEACLIKTRENGDKVYALSYYETSTGYKVFNVPGSAFDVVLGSDNSYYSQDAMGYAVSDETGEIEMMQGDYKILCTKNGSPIQLNKKYDYYLQKYNVVVKNTKTNKTIYTNSLYRVYKQD